MCGFVVFANFEKELDCKNILLKMNDKIKKRGPDEDGYYVQPHIALGHKRLIVIDPANRKAANDS